MSNYEISTTTPLKVSYSYYLSDRNADGEDIYRTTKIESETIGDKVTKYTYDELGNINAIQEKQTGGTYSEKSSYVYDTNGQPRYVYYVKDNGIYGIGYMVTNSRGDVVAFLNDDGDVVARYTYDVWENVLSVTDQNGNSITNAEHIASLNSLRYRGYYYDTVTGM